MTQICYFFQEREPVEITVEPHRISILSYSGPDRSISDADLLEAKVLRSRRYKNRRLGEFLKELSLAEGRATGVPTIQKELQKNGSAFAQLRTDEGRTFFLIDIPCREMGGCGVLQSVEPAAELLKRVDSKGFFKKITEIILDAAMQTPASSGASLPGIDMLSRILLSMLLCDRKCRCNS